MYSIRRASSLTASFAFVAGDLDRAGACFMTGDFGLRDGDGDLGLRDGDGDLGLRDGDLVLGFGDGELGLRDGELGLRDGELGLRDGDLILEIGEGDFPPRDGEEDFILEILTIYSFKYCKNIF